MISFLKKSILIGLVFAFIILSPKPLFRLFANTDTLINKIGCRIFEFNQISVKCASNLTLNKVIIETGDRVVFKGGTQQNRVGQEYGHTVLKIYYENLLISEVGHWKRNNWYSNEYEFNISKKGTNFIVDHEISGPDSHVDNFQKRYVYDQARELLRIDFLNEKGIIYNTEKGSK